MDDVKIRTIAPSLEVHDRLKDAQADGILVHCGVLSIETMSMRHGLDPEREREEGGKGKGERGQKRPLDVRASAVERSQ